MSIVSHPANANYRDNFDEVFRKKCSERGFPFGADGRLSWHTREHKNDSALPSCPGWEAWLKTGTSCRVYNTTCPTPDARQLADPKAPCLAGQVNDAEDEPAHTRGWIDPKRKSLGTTGDKDKR